MRKTIDPFLYYSLLSGFASLIFIVLGLSLVTLASIKISTPLAVAITLLLLWKGGLVGLITACFQKRSPNQEFHVKFIGRYLGSFYGIILGGMLGGKLASLLGQKAPLGSLIGAVVFFFLGRFGGLKLSGLLAKQMDRRFSLPEIQEQKPSPVAGFAPIGFLRLSAFFLPLLIVVSGLSLSYFDIPGDYLKAWLPISRIIVILISILSIAAPWLLKIRQATNARAARRLPETTLAGLGLSLSIIPVIYGLVLFMGMGASLLELCIYALVSTIAAILWSVKNPVPKEQNQGEIKIPGDDPIP